MIKVHNKKSQENTLISMNDRLLAAISYLSIFFLISLLRRNSVFVQLHARQGGVLFIMCVILNIAASSMPVIGDIVKVVGNVFIFIFSVWGILMAVLGRFWKMPYGIGDLIYSKLEKEKEISI